MAAKTKFEIYKDNKAQFRWRLLAANGEPVASSGEGFPEKRTAMNAVKKLKDWSNTDVVVDIEKMKEEAKKAAEKAKADKAKAKAAPKTTKKAPAKKAPAKKPATKKAEAPKAVVASATLI